MSMQMSISPSIEEVPKSEQRNKLEVPGKDSPIAGQESSDEMPLEVSRLEELSCNPSSCGCCPLRVSIPEIPVLEAAHLDLASRIWISIEGVLGPSTVYVAFTSPKMSCNRV